MAGRGGEGGKSKGRRGREREERGGRKGKGGEVDSDAQLEQGRRLAKTGPGLLHRFCSDKHLPKMTMFEIRCLTHCHR